MPRYERVKGWKPKMEADWLKSQERADILSGMTDNERKRRRFKWGGIPKFKLLSIKMFPTHIILLCLKLVGSFDGLGFSDVNKTSAFHIFICGCRSSCKALSKHIDLDVYHRHVRNSLIRLISLGQCTGNLNCLPPIFTSCVNYTHVANLALDCSWLVIGKRQRGIFFGIYRMEIQNSYWK